MTRNLRINNNFNQNMLSIKTNNRYLANYYSDTQKNYTDDSGVDLILPKNLKLQKGSNCIDMEISVESNESLFLLGRSSISKTPIRCGKISLDDDVGIKIMIECQEEVKLKKGERLFQIINHSLTPMKVITTNVFDIMCKIINYNDFMINQKGEIICLNDINIKDCSQYVMKLGITCCPKKRMGYLLTSSFSLIKMSNYEGVIDYGYRGEIMAKIDVEEEIIIPHGTICFQLHNPSFQSTNVIFTESFNEESFNHESEENSRGSGGFGSTGK